MRYDAYGTTQMGGQPIQGLDWVPSSIENLMQAIGGTPTAGGWSLSVWQNYSAGQTTVYLISPTGQSQQVWQGTGNSIPAIEQAGVDAFRNTVLGGWEGADPGIIVALQNSSQTTFAELWALVREVQSEEAISTTPEALALIASDDSGATGTAGATGPSDATGPAGATGATAASEQPPARPSDAPPDTAGAALAAIDPPAIAITPETLAAGPAPPSLAFIHGGAADAWMVGSALPPPPPPSPLAPGAAGDPASIGSVVAGVQLDLGRELLGGLAGPTSHTGTGTGWAAPEPLPAGSPGPSIDDSQRTVPGAIKPNGS